MTRRSEKGGKINEINKRRTVMKSSKNEDSIEGRVLRLTAFN